MICEMERKKPDEKNLDFEIIPKNALENKLTQQTRQINGFISRTR